MVGVFSADERRSGLGQGGVWIGQVVRRFRQQASDHSGQQVQLPGLLWALATFQKPIDAVLDLD